MLFFTSDQHYGHRNIISHCSRPFRDVEDMDATLIARHNEVVGHDDDVWHLGDFALKPSVMRRVLPLLRGRHRLVMGNHDACHPCHGHKADARRDEHLLAGFLELHTRTDITLPAPVGQVLLCHMPMANATVEFDERYLDWRPRVEDVGARWLIHGHVHEKWRVRGRMLNVGVDVWDFRPVALEEVMSVLREGR